MFKKLNKKGFTLAELLIVVAIIGVLVAVSIPIFTAQLKKSKAAVDAANARSIYSELSADYLANSGAYTITVAGSGVGGGTVTLTETTGEVNTFKFNDTCTALTITGGSGTTATPKVELTTNGTSYTFPGTTSGS
jgi:type IV pilus assembly protein PilA